MTRFSHIVAVSLLGIFAAIAIAAEGGAMTKDGTIKSADAKAKTFVLEREGFRPLTLKVDEKTEITLDGKASTFDAAIKPDRKVSVTYAKKGDDRVASKVEVKAGEAK